MPAFKYLCPDCGLSFDKILPSRLEQVSCKRCNRSAQVRLTASKGMFAHTPESPTPQNTGASSVDHDVDLIVARSSQANLREMQARQDYKKRLMHRQGVSGWHVARTPTGEVDDRGRHIDDYWVMSEDEKKLADKARPMAQRAAQQIHKEALLRRGTKPGTIDLGTE